MKHWGIVAWAAAATLICAVAAAAQFASQEHTWRDFKGVSSSAFDEASGDHAMQLSIEVPAGAHAVFAAFTTSEGFASWAVPVAHVDFRVGGSIEASYDPAARLGDPNNIRNRILAYVPDRVLVIKNEQAPQGFAGSALFQRTVTVIEFSALSANRTRVTLTNAGYGKGEAFDTVYRHFEWGNAYTLAELRKRFETGPVDWKARAAKQRAQEASERVQGKH